MKPILFNTEMVQVILEGRKTVTRRLIKPQPEGRPQKMPKNSCYPGGYGVPNSSRIIYCPFEPGDILYVRETWAFIPCIDCGLYRHGACRPEPTTYEDKEAISEGCFVYKEDYPEPERICWHPSIHMPKQAARIFLRVTGVRPERLREMVLGDVLMEGITETETYEGTWDRWHETWDSTLKPSDRPIYGWEANPWVWVVGFERVSKEVAEA